MSLNTLKLLTEIVVRSSLCCTSHTHSKRRSLLCASVSLSFSLIQLFSSVQIKHFSLFLCSVGLESFRRALQESLCLIWFSTCLYNAFIWRDFIDASEMQRLSSMSLLDTAFVPPSDQSSAGILSSIDKTTNQRAAHTKVPPQLPSGKPLLRAVTGNRSQW